MLKKVLHKIKKINPFQKSQPMLDGKGERVDIFYKKNLRTNEFDMYQLSHYQRYLFAKTFLSPSDSVGDFACGTGYGSMMLSEVAQKVTGADINSEVVNEIKLRYKKNKRVEFLSLNLLELNFSSCFDKIISFETIEHFPEEKIYELLKLYRKALKPGGKLIFSTPYMQEETEAAVKMGFHFTFYINEEKIVEWLKSAGFHVELFKYQNYETHTLQDHLEKKDFIICVATT